MVTTYHAGLVLEGGGMRGAFTAGVLDFFMDQGIMFSHIYGVSAGAFNALSYITEQRHRTFEVNLDYLDDERFLSMKNLIKTGNIFGVEMLFEEIPEKLNPIDYEAFRNWPGHFYAVITDVDTGEPVYYPVKDLNEDMIAIQASTALPLVAQIVPIGEHRYLDGGIGDSIPIRKAKEDGLNKCVVILTREEGYVKKHASTMPLMRRVYKEEPVFLEAVEKRPEVYNDTLAYIKEEKEQGNLIVIQPKEPVHISRTEKNKDKLRALYVQGYDQAKKAYPQMIEYLKDVKE